MFEAIELPARIADLNPSLSNVDAYDLPHLTLREPASENVKNGDGDRRAVRTPEENEGQWSELSSGFKKRI